MTDIGKKIRLARVVKDLTQIDLAKRSGISRQTIIAIERGQVTPTRETLVAICAVLGMDLNQDVPSLANK